jgi:hypothetical protein
MGINSFGKTFSKALASAEITPGKRRLKLHSLKTTCATLLFSWGLDRQLIKDRIGNHTDKSLEIYRRACQVHHEQVGQAMSLAFFHDLVPDAGKLKILPRADTPTIRHTPPSKSEPEPEPKPEPKPEPEPEPLTDPKDDPKNEPKDEPQYDTTYSPPSPDFSDPPDTQSNTSPPSSPKFLKNAVPPCSPTKKRKPNPDLTPSELELLSQIKPSILEKYLQSQSPTKTQSTPKYSITIINNAAAPFSFQ